MKLKILIADDEKAARYAMTQTLSRRGYEISEATDGEAAVEAIVEQSPDLVFLDLNMPKLDGLGVLRRLSERGHHTSEIIVVTANEGVQSAVECIRLGATDYITKPYEVDHIRSIAKRSARRVALEHQVEQLQDDLDREHALGAMVGVSEPMRQLFDTVRRAAVAPIDVLIRGETGTGKELIARELHRLSDRADGPFVAVNTAAIAESLAESELFGHVRGAFTGADRDRDGVFVQANGGTLFLDEIGDMPVATQTKILRALQQREIQPVGTSQSVAVDVRVISATHQDLEQAIADGHFRQDLYFRIRGVSIHVPPLRGRREDVILLANYFLQTAATQQNAQPARLSHTAIDSLLAHHWPGNVRELQQVVTTAAAMGDGPEITVADLALPTGSVVEGDLEYAALLDLPLTEAKALLVEQFERAAISAALREHTGNVSAAARQLGIHRQNLQQKMSQLGLERREGKDNRN